MNKIVLFLTSFLTVAVLGLSACAPKDRKYPEAASQEPASAAEPTPTPIPVVEEPVTPSPAANEVPADQPQVPELPPVIAVPQDPVAVEPAQPSVPEVNENVESALFKIAETKQSLASHVQAPEEKKRALRFAKAITGITLDFDTLELVVETSTLLGNFDTTFSPMYSSTGEYIGHENNQWIARTHYEATVQVLIPNVLALVTFKDPTATGYNSKLDMLVYRSDLSFDDSHLGQIFVVEKLVAGQPSVDIQIVLNKYGNATISNENKSVKKSIIMKVKKSGRDSVRKLNEGDVFSWTLSDDSIWTELLLRKKISLKSSGRFDLAFDLGDNNRSKKLSISF